jgi:hypothetical protein
MAESIQSENSDKLADAAVRLVVIVVDNEKYKVRAGRWVVADLKAFLGIDTALILSEVTPGGLKDLADNQRIELKDGERFITHARSGASS